MSNVFKTAFLLTGLTLLLMWMGQAIGGRGGMTAAFLMACVMNLGAYWFSDKIVLSMYRAQPLTENDAPEVYGIVRELAGEASLPMPRLYLIPTPAVNAFATGRNPKNAVVAVTQGIVAALNREELKGVLAHELAHVEHRDILISSIAATLAGAISLLANMLRYALMFGGGSRRDGGRETNPIALLGMAILVPIAAALVQLAVSRSRELHADDRGAVLSRNPLYLASALRKIEASQRSRPLPAEPSTAHLFIVNPLRGVNFAALFSTHPPVEQRIARLEAMAQEQGL